MDQEAPGLRVDLPSPPTGAAARYVEMRRTAIPLNSSMARMQGMGHHCTAARAMGIEVRGKTIHSESEWEMDVLAEYSM